MTWEDHPDRWECPRTLGRTNADGRDRDAIMTPERLIEAFLHVGVFSAAIWTTAMQRGPFGFATRIHAGCHQLSFAGAANATA